MYSNLKGFNNQKLLEETGLVNKMKEKGQSTLNNIKTGALGVKDGFDLTNLAYGRANNKVKNKIMGNDFNMDQYIKQSDLKNNRISKMYANKSKYPGTEIAHGVGRIIGSTANHIAHLSVPVAGIYGAKKLYDHYTDDPLADTAGSVVDNIQDNI